MLLLDRIISNSTIFPYFNAPFPGFAYPASDSFIQIRNECVSALDFTTMGMVKIALVQFDLMSQVDEIVDLFGKPEVAVSLIKRPLENMKKKSILCVERSEEVAARFQSVLQLVVKVFEAFKQDILPYGDRIDTNDTEYHGTLKCNKAVKNITGNMFMFVEMLRTKNETLRLEVVDQLNRMLEVCDQIVTSQTHEFDRSQNHSSLATRLAIINAKKFELVKNVLEINQNVGNVSMLEIRSTFQDEFQNLHHDGLTLVKEIDRLKPILQSLYQFKNNWSKETRFFTGLADSVKFDVHKKAVDFTSLMNTIRSLATSQEVDLMYKKTSSLIEVASKLEWVTSLYVNISDIYLSPCIDSEDSIDIEKACTRASKDIVHFVNERKIELWEKMVLHQSKLEEKFLHVQADDEHFSEVTEFEP
jgi:hypothetical protein